MTMQTLLMFGSFAVGVIGFACFLLLVALYTAHDRRQRRIHKRTETDKADLTILFQTMRDVIRQQKELARQFNADLEGKMEVVRQILSQTLEKNKKLYENQQAFAQELEQAKAQVLALQQQVGLIRSQPPTTGGGAAPGPNLLSPEMGVSLPRKNAGIQVSGAADADLELGMVLPSAHEAATRPRPEVPQPSAHADDSMGRRVRIEPRPAPEPVNLSPGATLSGTGLTQSRFQRWVGDNLDEPFAGGVDETGEEVAAPATPEDIEAARRAFQALLDRPAAAPGADPAAASRARSNGGNGGGSLAPLQQRVLEYNAAGMSVAQIARELGIGKGEVRLMLSLARQKRP